jgi:hypothetical protein
MKVFPSSSKPIKTKERKSKKKKLIVSLTPINLQSTMEEAESQSQKPSNSRAAKRTPQIMEFIRSHEKWLTTTRFNTTTWQENQRFLAKYPKIGCIYPSQEAISQSIPIDATVFILEMNNDENRILGIGIVKNHPICDPAKYRVYGDQNYNRFTYLSKQARIDRKEMTEEEELYMKVFDRLCFKSAKHMKRLRGIKLFPPEMLFRCSVKIDLITFITNMFRRRKPVASQIAKPEENT